MTGCVKGDLFVAGCEQFVKSAQVYCSFNKMLRQLVQDDVCNPQDSESSLCWFETDTRSMMASLCFRWRARGGVDSGAAGRESRRWWSQSSDPSKSTHTHTHLHLALLSARAVWLSLVGGMCLFLAGWKMIPYFQYDTANYSHPHKKF